MAVGLRLEHYRVDQRGQLFGQNARIGVLRG